MIEFEDNDKLTHLTMRIPLKYKTFFEKVNVLRDTDSWGEVLIESLKYNPKYNIVFERSDEFYKNHRTHVIPEDQDLKETQEIIDKTLEFPERESNQIIKRRIKA